MKNISLLPEQVRNYQKTSMQRNTLIIVALAGVLVFVIFYLILSLSLSKPQEDLKVMDQRKAEIQAKISELKQYEDALSNAEKKGTLIVQAMGNNPDWKVLFNGLFNQLPSDIRLTALKTEFKQDAQVLTIDGQTTGYSSVSDWLSKLQNSNGIKDVKCIYTSIAGSDSSTINFEITAAILQGGSYKLPASGGNKQ